MTEALVRLRLNEIEYDVKFDTWVHGNAGEKPNDKIIYTGGDMTDWLLRQVDNAIGEIKGRLRWCVIDHAHMTDDEIMDAPCYWEIRFRWQGKWNGSENALKSNAHQFVVQRCLESWYKMTEPRINGRHLPWEQYKAAGDEALDKLYLAARKTSIDTRFRL